MPITIRPRHVQFAAAHFLPNLPKGHKCRGMHGHTYRVWVEVGGNMVEGMLPDYDAIRSCVKHVCKGEHPHKLDHKTLNEIEGLHNPTTEVLAEWLAARLSGPIAELGGVLLEVLVDEGGHQCRWRP